MKFVPAANERYSVNANADRERDAHSARPFLSPCPSAGWSESLGQARVNPRL